MVFENINYVGIIAAAVSYMIVGSLWYSKALFAKQWMKASGMTEAQVNAGKRDMPMTYGGMFVGAIVSSFVLSVFIRFAGASDIVSAAQVAFWAWLGFVATVVAGSVLFERKSWTYFGVTAGYQLVAMVAAAAIIVTL